jgi:hypothetical protein
VALSANLFATTWRGSGRVVDPDWEADRLSDGMDVTSARSS